ncbi:hypothetical protein JOD54_004098 [Actinokineospora baliensis]|uniref:DUF4386 domain-containing protein n=1 Tax=Actinokineospora baliensis TaxID=547056 RepID=UPI00195D20A0|nr:DUF4386 domain-containing protein [Actinokineospora baliensis]MBM7773894.1 hypothetical protein [Actinokineospora baliensis]
MTKPVTLARTAGALYLLLAVLGGWAELFVRGSIRVPGDPAATAANIVANETLYRWGLAADVLMAVVFVLLGLTLQRLLHHVDHLAANALLVFVSVGAGLIVLNLALHAGALRATDDPALAALLLDLHTDGYVLAGVFFGLWLLPMGYLAYRSPLFPSVLGVLLMISTVAWVADPVLAFTLPTAPTLLREVVSAPTWIAEFGLMFYLLIRGVRTRD